MTLYSSLLFTWSLIFPKTEKKSTAQKSLFGSLLCIAISIVPLVVVFTVSNGMIYGMTERIIGLSSSHLEVVTHTEESAEDLKMFAKYFEKIDGVVGSYPEVQGAALASSASYRSGAQIRAIEKEMFTRNKSFKTMFTLLSGSYDNFSSRSAIVGRHIAEVLHLEVGSSFRIISAQHGKDGNLLPKASSFKVAAIISSGYEELDSLWIFVPLEQGFLILPQSEKHVLIETQDAFSPDLMRIQKECEEIAMQSFSSVYRWDELNQTQYENFSSTKVMLIFIMLLIVLVVSVNISASIVMLVMERKKEIAVLKSLGAHPGALSFSFLLAGLFIGFFGFLFGLIFGLLLSLNINFIINFFENVLNFFLHFGYAFLGHDYIPDFSVKLLDPAYYLSEVPIIIPLPELCIIGCATILLSLVMSFFPAQKAGSDRVLETLRKV
ncbi:MAG: ABC transporter permease [Treponema sp.]|nr:ABC transporter permease [Treponema sp.]